jgi:cell pole-organizing protein PopZ
MSDQAAPEPTMEEILASIRRIISEDDQPIASDAGKADDGWRPPAAAEQAASADDDVLELNEPVRAAETHGDVEVFDRPIAAAPEAAEPAPAPEPEPEPVVAAAPPPPPTPTAPPPPAASASLIGADTAQRSASAFGRLTAATRAEPTAAPALPAAGRTLEDLTRDLLAPMLKAWLDENLARIVQARVDEEVERIARGKVG